MIEHPLTGKTSSKAIIKDEKRMGIKGSGLSGKSYVAAFMAIFAMNQGIWA
jgi:hypothetical protein